MRWNTLDLSSPDTAHGSDCYREVSVAEFIGPRYSTAMGWNMWLDVRSAYFATLCYRVDEIHASFLFDAWSATTPAPVAAMSVYDAANVRATVTSQIRGFPPCHAMRVSPSGRLPSRLFTPDGSLVADTSAALKARQIVSDALRYYQVPGTQVNTPRRNPRQTESIFLPRRNGRLSWPRWPVTYRDGLWSPIQILMQQCTTVSRTRNVLITSQSKCSWNWLIKVFIDTDTGYWLVVRCLGEVRVYDYLAKLIVSWIKFNQPGTAVLWLPKCVSCSLKLNSLFLFTSVVKM